VTQEGDRKISVNSSYGVMNPLKSLDLNIIEAVMDHLDQQRNKRHQTSKDKLRDVLHEVWRTIPGLLKEMLSKTVQAMLKDIAQYGG